MHALSYPKPEVINMALYCSESHICTDEKRSIELINMVPELQWDEKNAAKTAIEETLYGIFSRFFTNTDPK